MNRLRNFINENNLSFNVGSRNSTIVCLIGFCQHIDLSQSDLEDELALEIEDDYLIQEEIDRLWDYCKNRNYKNYWSTLEAKNKYKF